MAELFAGIMAFVKAIPAVERIVDQLVILYVEAKNSSVDRSYEEASTERRKLTEQYKKATTNEERKKIFVKLITNKSN